MQITIDEYAKRFKMSKEMIRAKLRAGRLPHTTVDGMTYITVDVPAASPETSATQTPQRTTAGRGCWSASTSTRAKKPVLIRRGIARKWP